MTAFEMMLDHNVNGVGVVRKEDNTLTDVFSASDFRGLQFEPGWFSI